MGDRVLMQMVDKAAGEFGPVVYGHWSGSVAKETIEALAAKMETRKGDLDYASARLVQVLIETTGNGDDNTGIGIWNADAVLNAGDSQGDAGIYLIDPNTFEYEHIK